MIHRPLITHLLLLLTCLTLAPAWGAKRTLMEEDAGIYSALRYLPASPTLNTAKLQAGIAAHPTTPITFLVTPGEWAVTSSLTFPDHMLVTPARGARFVISAGVTLTLNMEADPGQEVFTGPGAATGVVLSKLIPEAYPQWWGAIGDGVTESTTAFQAAIVARATHGGRVSITSGTYLLGSLTPSSKVSLECASWASILQVKNNLNADFIVKTYSDPQTDHVSIRNCQIDGNKANNTAGSAIQIFGDNILIEGNYIHDPADACVVLGKPTGPDAMRILHNWCHNPAKSGNFWGAFAFTGGDNLLMSGNLATSTDHFSAYGYDIEPNPLWTVNNARLTNNSSTAGGLVVTAGAGGGATVSNIHIADNWIDSYQSAGTGHGLHLRDIGGSVTVQNNYVRGGAHTSSGVALIGLNGAKVTGNDIVFGGASQTTYPNHAGILVEDTTNSVIEQNTIRMYQTTDALHAIVERGASSSNIFRANDAFGLQVYRVLGPTYIRSVDRRANNSVAFSAFTSAGIAENLLLRSEEIDHAAWTTSNTTITANAVVDPLGFLTAERVVAAGAGLVYVSQVGVPAAINTTYTASVWLRVASSTLLIPIEFGGNVSGRSATSLLATTAWQRISLTHTTGATDATLELYVNHSGLSNDFYLWGGQIETASEPGAYVRTGATALSASEGTNLMGTQVKGLLVNSYALNLTAPAPPACVESSAQGFGGAALGDLCVPSLSVSVPTGQELSCHVSATNLVIFRVCGAATDPDGAGATYRAAVWKF
jgi:hypothetical protein